MDGEQAPATIEDRFVERVDSERLALRPGWRLFRAHPAIGLEETEGDVAHDLKPHELGVRWLSLAAEEQQARERDFLRALLGRAAACPDPQVGFGWMRDAARTEALARRCGASIAPDGSAIGPLDEAAIDALLEEAPEVCYAAGGDELVIDMGGPSSVTVWMDRWKAPALQRELLDVVHDAAERRATGDASALEPRRRREVDRTLRAHVLVAWSRHSTKPVSVAFALIVLLGWHPLGDGWAADIVVATVVALVVLVALGRLVHGWYRRSG